MGKEESGEGRRRRWARIVTERDGRRLGRLEGRGAG